MSMIKMIFRNASIAGGLLVAAAAVLYILFPSSEIQPIVSAVLPMLLSFMGAFLAYGVYRHLRASRTAGVSGGAMTIGLLFWAAGEMIWLAYELTGNLDVPYPSVADVAWLIGYLPLFLSIGLQHRSLRAPIPRRSWVLYAVLMTAAVVAAVWLVIAPILSDPAAGTPVELFFSLAYPVGDLILLSMTMLLALNFLGGQLALPWAVIAAGMLLHSVSDLLFAYLEWNGLYYPGGQLNFSSGLFDILYLSAYVVWNIGLNLRFWSPEPGKDVDLQTFIPEQGKGFLLLTDQKGRVIFMDPALQPVLGLKNAEDGVGKGFGPLFGLPAAFEQAAVRKAARTGVSDDYTVSLGLSRAKYRLRVVASGDQKEFSGFDVLVHPDRPQPPPPAERETVILGQVASRARESSRRDPGPEDLLREYCDTLLELLFIMVSRAGGAGVGSAFEAVLDKKARSIGCSFKLKNGRAVWNDRRAEPAQYRALLEEAIRYSSEIISASTIGQKIEEIERLMDPECVREAKEQGLLQASGRKSDTD
jgi:hypothetical protein